ncbi:MAG: hypothetical protein JST12_03810 [Armatimonadetes bacterium]|nr:hypothetical protein [Armatimonadota bacterium]MBS1728749.1 hypothetical protein [Armatimonadota bacterium]
MSREHQVIWLAADGKTDKTIAQLLGISTDTVSTYWKRIMVKYNSSSRTEVVATFLRQRFEFQIDKVDTERRTLKKELREKSVAEQQQQVATAHLNSLMNLLDVGVLFTSNGFKVTYVNEQLCYLAGCELTPKEIIGTDLEYFLANSRNRTISTDYTTINRLRTLGGAGAERTVDQLVMTDGKILERTFCTLTVKGNPVGNLILYKDVTSIVKDKNELRAKSQLSELLTNRAIEHMKANPKQQPREIIRTLEAVATFLGADRSMIGEIDLQKGTFNIDYAWQKTGEEILVGNYQPIPLSFFPWLRKQVGERDFWIMDTMKDFPKAASMEKAVYEEAGVRSTVGISFTSEEAGRAYFVDFSYSKEHQTNRKLIETLLPIKQILGTVIADAMAKDKSKPGE